MIAARGIKLMMKCKSRNDDTYIVQSSTRTYQRFTQIYDDFLYPTNQIQSSYKFGTLYTKE